MQNIKIFIKTYWTNVKSILDLILFVIAIASLMLGIQFALSVSIGLLILLAVVVIASYRTWLYQYNETLSFLERQEKDIGYSDLNDIQQSILRGLSSESDKRIISIERMSGTMFMGVGDVDKEHSWDEIGAEIIELANLDILRVDGYSKKSGKPIYKPTARGLRIIKEIEKDE